MTDLEGNLIRKDRLDEVRYGKTGKPELLAESAMQFWFSFMDSSYLVTAQ